MRVNLTTILKQAQADGTGVGAFNTPNLESVRAVIAAAEAANQPSPRATKHCASVTNT